MNAHTHIDVNGGFYTVAEAARLLGMGNWQRVTRWLAPPKSGGDPVILRDYPKIGREHELSFLDLIEVKFVEHFRSVRISLQALRAAARNARDELGVSHPFATGSVRFQTDRKQVFLDTARQTGDRQLLNLMTRQVELYDVIEQTFARDLEFNVEGLAKCWRPAPDIAPKVFVSPVYAFGRPVISDRYIPTRTLFDGWLANDQNADAVADWFDVDTLDVDQAVTFERRPIH